MKFVIPDDLLVARVLNEDNDFITLEVGKRNDVSFTLQRDENNEVVGGDQFYTLIFVRADGGEPEVWKPWEDG